MAYISKEEKNAKAVLLRALGKDHGVKLTVARDHYSFHKCVLSLVYTLTNTNVLLKHQTRLKTHL